MDIKIKRGNSKLSKDTFVINITSYTDCPSRLLGFCILGDRCYARNPELRFKKSLPYRRLQEFIWDNTSSLDIALQIIGIQKNAYKKARYLRFSESGDFKCQNDIAKMDYIAKMIKPYGITTYGYTARRDLDYSNVENMIVNGTGFMISNRIKLVKEYNDSMVLQCKSDCRVCDYCKIAGNKNIHFKIR